MVSVSKRSDWLEKRRTARVGWVVPVLEQGWLSALGVEGSGFLCYIGQPHIFNSREILSNLLSRKPNIPEGLPVLHRWCLELLGLQMKMSAEHSEELRLDFAFFTEYFVVTH